MITTAIYSLPGADGFCSKKAVKENVLRNTYEYSRRLAASIKVSLSFHDLRNPPQLYPHITIVYLVSSECLWLWLLELMSQLSKQNGPVEA